MDSMLSLSHTHLHRHTQKLVSSLSHLHPSHTWWVLKLTHSHLSHCFSHTAIISFRRLVGEKPHKLYRALLWDFNCSFWCFLVHIGASQLDGKRLSASVPQIKNSTEVQSIMRASKWWQNRFYFRVNYSFKTQSQYVSLERAFECFILSLGLSLDFPDSLSIFTMKSSGRFCEHPLPCSCEMKYYSLNCKSPR